MKIREEKGITLVTLTVAVTILIILSSMLIYNSKASIKMRNLKMMQNDIELLDDKIDAYYIKYGALPISILYSGTINFEPQANDSDEYYVIDLSAIEGITLNYGLDFNNIETEKDITNLTDLYIINTESHHIYYPKGIKYDGEMYYTTSSEDDEISMIEIPEKLEIVPDSLGIVPEINKNEMTPVKYDDTTNEWVAADPSVAGDWFDYSAKQWANVKTENGYFVYIPRYAYKITSGYHKSLLETAGTIEIVFLNGDNTLKTTTDSQGNKVNQSDLVKADEVNSSVVNKGINATTKYIIHPAFEAFGEVDGLWVAKYEMSREDKQEDGTWKQTTVTGDVTAGEDIRMISKAGISSWRNIKVTNIFENCYNMNRTLDSHMMKNTEWGAVAYLTVSEYGKGELSEVELNKSSSYYTGYGADSTLSKGAASTTGNVYGIFDLSGGASEYVAAYLDDEATRKTETTTGSMYNYNKNLIESDSKYKDVYQIKTNEDGTTSNAYEDCYVANNLKVGDALWEVTSDTGSTYGWYGDWSGFVGFNRWLHPVFKRGDYYNSSGFVPGVFYAEKDYGSGGQNISFRVVCVVE